MGGTSRVGAAIAAAVVLVAACSDDAAEPEASGTTTTATTTTTAAARTPDVEPAALEGPITVGTSSPPATPGGIDVADIGYVEEEFFASGTATAYTADESLPEDGTWEVEPSTTAPYRTRFVVRRPADPARFSGIVVVEWLNVTVAEAGPDWGYTNRAIVDAGAAWVGLSVQSLGVMGGTSLLSTGGEPPQVTGLRDSNPERYGSLEHPGDAYAFDIYSQVGAAIRSPGDVPVLGGAEARHVVAIGESQSAAYLTGYLNGIHPNAGVYDGFFVHSRGAGAAVPGRGLDMTGTSSAPRIRADLDVPVLVFETETDVGPLLQYGRARQPDTDLLRVWEVAGTAHADAFLVGGSFAGCAAAINDGPQHFVANAALEALLAWVTDGVAPPSAEPIETDPADPTAIVRDDHGIARGGVRTPSVDVPVKTLSGEAPEGSPILCALFGTSTPFDAATLAALYPTQQDYLDAFDAALDAAIEAGFVRAADRERYAAEARAVSFEGA